MERSSAVLSLHTMIRPRITAVAALLMASGLAGLNGKHVPEAADSADRLREIVRAYLQPIIVPALATTRKLKIAKLLVSGAPGPLLLLATERVVLAEEWCLTERAALRIALAQVNLKLYYRAV